MIQKNRNKEKYSFANINLLGKCNADCYFCLGKDIKEDLKGKNQLNIHYSKWRNFHTFLSKCKEYGVYKLYLTGQTADGLQYKYLDEIIEDLQSNGFIVGVRTNGFLAKQKIQSIIKMEGEIGYSIHTLNKNTQRKIMGTGFIPDWSNIIACSGDNVRVSIVLNRYNINEFYSLIKYISTFKNVRYVQIRRISTDTREKELLEDIILYEEFYNKFSRENKQIGTYYLAQQYLLFGKEINFWRTVETSCNSLNYFTDGTVSDEYFIIEGYLKNKKD